MTDSKQPRLPAFHSIGGDRGCDRGGSFHDDYVALIAQDLPSLLAVMVRQDVVAIINAAPKLKAKLSNRADKLFNLFQVLESGHFDTDSPAFGHDMWGESPFLSAPLGPQLAQALLDAAEAEYILWVNAKGHDPHDIWSHLVKVGAILIWNQLKSCEGGLLDDRYLYLNKADAFALRNCLRVFHSGPHVPMDVPVEELRYTHCTVNSVFSRGSHAGMSLQSTVDQLASSTLNAQSESMVLNVVLHKGMLFSLNNRRLWCLKEHASGRPRLYVRVLRWPLARGVLFNGEEICDQFCRSLTTTNEGISVKVRYADREQQSQPEAAMASTIDNQSNAGGMQESPNSITNIGTDHHPENVDSIVTDLISRPPSPVAELSPEEAAEIAGERWASWVQDRAWDAVLSDEHLPAKLVVLRFSRHERILEDVVLHSEVARKAAMQRADLCPPWANGAKVLLPDVRPEFFDQELEHFNVVVREEDVLELLRELEEKLPHRNRQLKAGFGRSMVPDKLSLCNVSQGNTSSSNETVLDMAGMRVVRTFIDIPRAKPQVKSSNTW